MEHDICLNIHYSAPKEIWNIIQEVYTSMDYWFGYDDGLPAWRGENIDLQASVESGGIQIYGEMLNEIWNKWYGELKSKLSVKLGYEIGDAQEGYKFKYWEPFEKQYSNIKDMDNTKITFDDYSTFYWEDFDENEKSTSAKKLYYIFKSSLIELCIYFDNDGAIPKKRQQQDFRAFQSKLKELGIL